MQRAAMAGPKFLPKKSCHRNPGAVFSARRTGRRVEAAAYFCILEALTNAAKHADATEVLVTLRGRPHLSFSVTDDGRGFDRDHVVIGGLLGMEARVAAAGGRLTLETGPGRGTVLRGEFPADRPA